jgi:hypothetical protein
MVGPIALATLLDRLALGGIALGFILVFQPWGGTLRSGFFVTLVATILHVVTSHLELPGTGRGCDGRPTEDEAKGSP